MIGGFAQHTGNKDSSVQQLEIFTVSGPEDVKPFAHLPAR